VGRGFALSRVHLPINLPHTASSCRPCEPLMAGYIDCEAETFLAHCHFSGPGFQYPGDGDQRLWYTTLIVWVHWAFTLGFSLGSRLALPVSVSQGASKPLQLPGLNGE
jgi:hypothetical protein